MRCPKCNSKDIQVKRTIKKKRFNIRYRVCNKCTYKFKTKEIYSDGWDYRKIVQNIKKMLEDIDDE